MSVKICKPYKKAQKSHITQGFHKKHRAIDMAYKYGTFLVAPENCIVEKITTPKTLDNSTKGLEQGYGLLMESVVGNRRYAYWHCLPIFPVEVGEIVLQGQIVAQMGNSGYVKMGNKYVPIDKRLGKKKPGTHLHFSMSINGKIVNPLDYIDWSIPVKYSFLDVIRAVRRILQKMLSL